MSAGVSCESLPSASRLLQQVKVHLTSPLPGPSFFRPSLLFHLKLVAQDRLQGIEEIQGAKVSI
jgi:hypothetical protein